MYKIRQEEYISSARFREEESVVSRYISRYTMLIGQVSSLTSQRYVQFQERSLGFSEISLDKSDGSPIPTFITGY